MKSVLLRGDTHPGGVDKDIIETNIELKVNLASDLIKNELQKDEK